VIELPGIRAGAVVEARLLGKLAGGKRGICSLVDGSEALVQPLDAALMIGETFNALVDREAIAEPGRPKRARVRPTTDAQRAGPRLAQRVANASILSVHGPDRLEQAGWSELLEEARTGEIAFDGGSLRMSLTPAMTLFDVDGNLSPADLAIAGARAAAVAIQRHSIGGSIGIDLPTITGRAERQRAAAEVDAILPQPFERTSVNGFGFLQIVRRKERPSVPEIVQSDPVAAAARALMRRAQRAPVGALVVEAAPAVIRHIEANAGWLEALQRSAGGTVTLQPSPGLAISGGHVQARES
jgi:hypothetical protein